MKKYTVPMAGNKVKTSKMHNECAVKQKSPTSLRRNFMKKAAVSTAGLALASTFSSPAIASNKRRLKMVLTWPKNFPGLGTAAQRLKKSIEEATDGRFVIKLYGAGELVPAFEAFDAVQNGTADMYHGAAYYWQRKNSAFPFFSAVPFGMTYTEYEAWIHWGGGQRLWDKLYAKFSLKPFLVGGSGVQMGGFFRKEIKSAEDFKGLKMRIPGLGGSVIQKLGASTINLPAGEIFQALETGTIDATEWVGPWHDLAMGFYKVAPYYYYPGFHEPGSVWEFVFNKGVWDSFSKADKTRIRICAGSESALSFSEFNARNSVALTTLIEKYNVALREFSESTYKAFAKATKSVLREIVDSNKDAAEIYVSYKDFYKKMEKWTEISENAYINRRKEVWDFDS